MAQQRTIWVFMGLLFLSSLACNAFAGDAEPGAVTLPAPPVSTVSTVVGNTPIAGVTNTPGGLAPTATLPGGATAVSTLPAGSTPGVPTVTTLVDLNIRSGPGVGYDRIGFLLQGQSATVVGRDPASGWWKIQCPITVPGPECWVSGGAQYTTAVYTNNVPAAPIPPTPTPIPPTATAPATATGQVNSSGAYVAYANNQGLWVMSLNTGQNPPTAGTPTQIVNNISIQQIIISPNGQKIGYLAGVAEVNQLYVVNRDGSGNTLLVNSADLPGGEAQTAVLIRQVQWLADNQTLAFNTNISSLVVPGVGSQEDLWTVTPGSTPTQRFAAGSGGGAFAISGNNQVILAQADKIIRVNLDGSGVETVITFPFINTASEYIYYPQAQWTTDNSQAYIAVPSQDPFASKSFAALWRIPTSGAATQSGTVLGNILFNPVIWSPGGNILGYVKMVLDPSNPPPVVMLADGGGQNQAAYATETNSRFLAWSPGGSRFLYTGENVYAVGQAGLLPVAFPLSNNQAVSSGHWLNEETFLVGVGEGNTWSLNMGTAVGVNSPLVTVSTNGGFQFDVWGP